MVTPIQPGKSVEILINENWDVQVFVDNVRRILVINSKSITLTDTRVVLPTDDQIEDDYREHTPPAYQD